MKIGLIQLNTGSNKALNLAKAEVEVEKAVNEGARLILLPENFNFRGTDEENIAEAESIPGVSSEWACEMARRHSVYFHLGSMIEKRQSKGGQQYEDKLANGRENSEAGQYANYSNKRFHTEEVLYNTSVVYDPQGEEVVRYSKIHLFDVDLPDGMTHRESSVVSAGKDIVTFTCEGLCFGLAICYDLRFPELFRALVDKGAQVFLVPAAFTVPTGISHWEVLLRARAIENGCYVVACGQWGPSDIGKNTYGHSMIVDPWGVIIAQCREEVGCIVGEVDADYIHTVRKRMPIHKHRRSDLFFS